MIFFIEEKDADSPALQSDQGITVTYGELMQEALKFGATCKMNSQQDRRFLIFCMCENTPGAVIGYLGALEYSGVPLLLGADLSREQFESFYRRYEPRFIWAPQDWTQKIPPPEDEPPWKPIYHTHGYSLLSTGFSPCPMYPELGLLLATSGSTGSPKLVRLSRRNLEANTASISEYLQLNKKDRPITTLPMQYTYGLSIINSHLLAGSCILMTTASLVQEDFWKFFQEQQATSFGGVPYTYEMLKRLRIFRKKLPSLTSMTQAGGKLPEALQQEVGTWARDQGIRFYVMYGQTEATARMGYLPPEKCLEKPGSIGIAIPGGTFFLADETGQSISQEEQVGELVYQGPNVSLGYAHEKKDLLLGDERKGLLFTGDMAKRDKDGYYYIQGRRKRFVKLFGVRVGLDECEQVLGTHYRNVAFACAGTDNHLDIFCTDAGVADQAADFLADFLHLGRKAFECHHVPEIPKSSSGKIQYAELARMTQE